MKTQVFYKNIDKSEALDKSVNEKLSKLDKYFKHEAEAKITCSKIKKNLKVDVIIPFNGLIVRAEDTSDDLYGSIDRVMEKLERQFRKYKTRIEKRHTKDSLRYPEFNEQAFQDLKDEKDALKADEPSIVKIKKIEAKPMSDEEAILQMELLGHDFFVYQNEELETKVLYKRKDGNYGLMETQK